MKESRCRLTRRRTFALVFAAAIVFLVAFWRPSGASSEAKVDESLAGIRDAEGGPLGARGSRAPPFFMEDGTTRSSIDFSAEYVDFAQSVLLRRLGPFLFKAMFDAEIYREYLKGTLLLNTSFFTTVETSRWILKPLKTLQISSPKALLHIKHASCVALGNLVFDLQLSEQYNAYRSILQSGNGSAATGDAMFLLRTFSSRLGNWLEGYVKYHLLLLTTLSETSEDVHLVEKMRAACAAPNSGVALGHRHPLVAVLADISASSTERSVQDLLAHCSMSKAVSQMLLGPLSEFELSGISNQPTGARWTAQRPEHQKFMYHFRPQASCTSLQRECEAPDVCRYLCNLRYLQFAKPSPDATQPFYHRLVGIGSNNDYSWELAVSSIFSLPAASNGLFSLTTFDCTVNWVPPHQLMRPGSGWGRSSICVASAHPSSVTVSQMLTVVTETELLPEGEEKYKTRRWAVALPSSQAPQSGGTFDAISVLKVDIEGHEFGFVEQWGELHRRRLAGANLDDRIREIDHSRLAPITASQVLMEIHSEDRYEGSVWEMHKLFQTMHALGYLHVNLELNLVSRNCAEIVFVHYRYFMRSELWLARRDDM